MENNNNVSNDGVFALLTYNFGDEIQSDVIYNVCTKVNWNLDDCTNNLAKMRKQAKNRNSTKIENDADIVVESEETQNTIGNSDNLVDLEEGVGNIDVEGGKVHVDSQPFTYAGAIKKTNRKSKSFPEIVDVTGSPIRSKPKTIFHDRPQLQEISNQILKGIKVMVIMRGAPGSGKSHLAKEIIDATTCDDYCNHIFSSDDYFYDSRGNYQFAAHRLGEVHENNRQRVNYYACRNWSPIIVDNTNMKVWEMKSYFDIAVRCGYLVHILEANNSWSQSPGRLALKNSHGVPKESIERMLNGYEPTTVAAVMESFGLNYAMAMPQYRQFPPLIPNSTQLNNAIQTPKSQRNSIRRLPKRNNFESSSQVPDLVQYETVEEAFRNVDKSDEWTSFDRERVEFWNNNAAQVSHVSSPKQQRNPKGTSTEIRSGTVTKNELHSNLFAILKENNENFVDNKSPTEEEAKDTKVVLHKHRKNCRNENDSFAQIRQIYPSVSLDILWDLFEKCEGDGDWTMDILLKDETRINEYDSTDSNANGSKNDFDCDCDGGGSKTFHVDQTNVPSASVEDESNALTYQQRPNRNRLAFNTEEQLAAKRLIEGSFQIGDEHYSIHTRKIRNLRRGVTASPAVIPDSTTDNEESACAVDVTETDSNEKDDELLEVNLGMDLVCQLDSVFGVEAYQRDALDNLKTNVFMPKSLAQQLYALWMESMYNQLEEQRQKSIKDDAEFARQLQSQQNYPGLHKHAKPPSDLKDIMEMEYALAAYRTEMDEWKTKTPQDLALQMTHDKLCNIFPDIDRETLVEVLAAHNNKFSETVDVLKDTLSGKSDDKIASEGRQLFEEVQTEVEATTTNFKPSRPTSQLMWESRKLGPDEAKRAALKEFEDTRNLAMRHTQLKAECYNKAKEAIQRGNTSVALYYSQVANLHKTKIDTYNHKAANCIMEVHNLTQKNPDMLDLHYLHVNEAAECLDLFLDKHITKLKTKPQSYKYIFVITGRGLHSANGISTIKQKVKNRFRDRNLTWSEVNPGLLKVKIFVNSRLTINL